MSPRQIVSVVAVAIIGIFLLSTFGSIVENLDADQIMVIQSPGGKLTVYTTPGYKMQWFGKVTKYNKRSIYEFSTKMRFNDGAHGTLNGSIQYELPLTEQNVIEIHTKFGSQEAVQKQLVETVVDKSIYMTGPLMSSKQSYAEMRNQLISFIEDQVSNGVYKTRQKDVRIQDDLTKEYRTVTVVEIVTNNDGVTAQRQEPSVLGQFGIKTFNFSVNGKDGLTYEDAVEDQIKEQQKATMAVQTAIADAKKAEQDVLTAAKNGEANATKARWEQEVIKAKIVTTAQQEKEVAVLKGQQNFEVAKLNADAAEQYMREQKLKAEGDATYKREVIKADGALAQKIEALKYINNQWAAAFANRQTPKVVMGGDKDGSDSDAARMMQLIGIKAAKDLAIDMEVPKQ